MYIVWAYGTYLAVSFPACASGHNRARRFRLATHE
jgi:hypothetical protein